MKTEEKIDKSTKVSIIYFCIGNSPDYEGPHVHLSPCGHIYNRKTETQSAHNLCIECYAKK